MSVTLDLTQSQILAALRTGFLLPILPAGVEVVVAQTNRTPPPAVANFVAMTPLFRERLATNTTRYPRDGNNAPATRVSTQPTKVTVQLDVIGPDSAEHAQKISTLWRDDYAATVLGRASSLIQPLYCDDPRQMPWMSGEQQASYRWSIDLHLQANISAAVAQDFATDIASGIYEMDATYPP